MLKWLVVMKYTGIIQMKTFGFSYSFLLQCSMPFWATMAIWAKPKFYAKRVAFGLGLFGSLIYYI
jgi:hypothetical protein